MKVVFVAFGGGSPNYHAAVDRICEQAAQFQIFDKIYKFKDIDLLSWGEFWQKHSQFILTHRRGMGHWIWKGYLVYKVLGELDEGDILVYVDSGCELNIWGKPRMLEYIKMAVEHTFLGFEITSAEKEWTKRDLIDYIGCDPNSKHIIATASLVKKCEASMKFYKELLDLYCAENYHFIDDSPSVARYDEFVDHRHDQSCYSVLMKKWNNFTIPDETYFHPNWGEKGAKFPIWALRNRTGNSVFLQK